MVSAPTDLILCDARFNKVGSLGCRDEIVHFVEGRPITGAEVSDQLLGDDLRWRDNQDARGVANVRNEGCDPRLASAGRENDESCSAPVAIHEPCT